MFEAGRLKREIKKELNLKPRMSFAGVGVLDVIVDGKTIFSRLTEHRMPAAGEIVKRIQAYQGTGR